MQHEMHDTLANLIHSAECIDHGVLNNPNNYLRRIQSDMLTRI